MTLPSDRTPGPDHAAPTTGPSFTARARKFLVAALGLLALVVTSGVLDEPQYDTVRTWVTAILAIATAAGVYRVPNAPSR